MTNDEQPFVVALQLAGKRAHGMALILADKVGSSDIPPEHWGEIIERLRELLQEEASRRRPGLTNEDL